MNSTVKNLIIVGGIALVITLGWLIYSTTSTKTYEVTAQVMFKNIPPDSQPIWKCVLKFEIEGKVISEWFEMPKSEYDKISASYVTVKLKVQATPDLTSIKVLEVIP